MATTSGAETAPGDPRLRRRSRRPLRSAALASVVTVVAGLAVHHAGPRQERVLCPRRAHIARLRHARSACLRQECDARRLLQHPHRATTDDQSRGTSPQTCDPRQENEITGPPPGPRSSETIPIPVDPARTARRTPSAPANARPYLRVPKVRRARRVPPAPLVRRGRRAPPTPWCAPRGRGYSCRAVHGRRAGLGRRRLRRQHVDRLAHCAAGSEPVNAVGTPVTSGPATGWKAIAVGGVGIVSSTTAYVICAA